MASLLSERTIDFPDVCTEPVKPKAPALGRVVANEVCTHGKSNAWIRNVSIDLTGSGLDGRFCVGQAIGVIPPGHDARGKAHKVRLYSIASPAAGEDGHGAVVCTPVKRVVDEHRLEPGEARRRRGLFMGVCSNYLSDLAPGDEVHVTGPVGKRFLLPRETEAHEYVFVATGTGIAPYRGMLLELFRSARGPTRRDVWLLMGAPYTTDLIYHELLVSLAEEFENFHYLRAISREPFDGQERGIYVDRLLELERAGLGPVLAGPDTLLYLCGLAGMQFGVYRRLATLGLLESYAALDRMSGPPDVWRDDELKRAARPTDRCRIEVY
jgi:ferredoxin--NADP+ reductase